MLIKAICEGNDLRLDFGYHKGKLLSQVAEEEPGYIFYLVKLLASRLELCEARREPKR